MEGIATLPFTHPSPPVLFAALIIPRANDTGQSEKAGEEEEERDVE